MTEYLEFKKFTGWAQDNGDDTRKLRMLLKEISKLIKLKEIKN